MDAPSPRRHPRADASDQRRAELLAVVLGRGYTRAERPFRLASGGESFDYVDLRRAFARGEDLAVAASALIGELERRAVAFDAIGGMTMGADPLAHAVAVLKPTSWFSVRKAEKSHGTGRRIEGCELGPGVRVVLVEDTVSTGRSSLEALEVVEATGATVVEATTVLDRGDVAAITFAARGVAYSSLLSYEDLGIEPIGGGGASASGS